MLIIYKLRKWHPDTSSNKEMAEIMTMEINHEYALLIKYFK